MRVRVTLPAERTASRVTHRVCSAVLSQIWGVCDPSGTGSLTRDGLYKSLALSAVAQEGRAVEERALKSFRDSGEDGRGGRVSGFTR